MHRVLITGAGGGIGRGLRETLRGVYPVLRLSDRVEIAPAREGEEVDQTELSDMASVERMVAGCDGIVHLGGISGENSWEKILEGNIVGLYNTFEAARRAGVQRIVMATSNHAVGFYPRAQTIDHQVTVRPDSRYGVSKAFSEALASLYSDKHGIGFLCVRIGNYGTRPIDSRRLSIWVSPRDLTQLVRIGLEHPGCPLRDRLRRLGQQALVVRQLERLPARLQAGGRFRAASRPGAVGRGRPAQKPDRREIPGRHLLRRGIRRDQRAEYKSPLSYAGEGEAISKR